MRAKTYTAILGAILGAALITAATYTVAQAESAGDYIDDTTISTKIKAELLEDQELKAFSIHVSTDNGVVDLTGSVHDAAQKTNAEQIAHAVKGVKDVKDDITVQ